MNARGSLRPTVLAVLAASLLGSSAASGAEPRKGKSRGGGGQGSPAEQLEATLGDLEGLERRFEAVRAEVAAGPLTRSPALVSARFNDAVYAYLTGEYDRAALLFYSLIEHGDLRGRSEAPEGQWYLAECLYQGGNLHAARSFFQRVVDAGPSHPFYEDSLLKVIEVHGLVGDLTGFRRLFDAHRGEIRDRTAPAALRVRYAMGKALYQAGDYPLAREQFADFPRGSALTPMARYFAGALKVRDGHARSTAGDRAGALAIYREAIPLFEEVLGLPVSTEEHRRVLDLTALALGQIRFELGEYAEAVTAWQRIGADSEQYPEALYASCLAFAQQGDLPGAAQAAGAFERAWPGHARAPEVRILLADLQVKAKQFGEAVGSYQKVAGEYRGIQEQLSRMIAGRADPLELFNELVDRAMRAAAPQAGGTEPKADAMPAFAAELARRDARLTRAVEVASDLREQEADITTGQETLRRVEENLGSVQAESLLAGYRIARRELDRSMALGLQVQSRLVQIEADWLSGKGLLPADALPARGDLARKALEAAQIEQDSADRKDDWQLQAAAVATRAARVESLADDLLARAAAVELAAASRGDGPALAEVQALRADLREASGQAAAEGRRIEPARVTSGYEQAGAAAARAAEEALGADVESLRLRLQALRGSASDSASADLFRKIDGARERVSALRTAAVGVTGQLDMHEMKELEEIRQIVREERDNLARYAEEAVQVDAASRGVSGSIARSSFDRIGGRIDDLVMRADAGSADVYWFEMENLAADKRAVQDEQSRRLRSLESSFEEVLRDAEEKP